MFAGNGESVMAYAEGNGAFALNVHHVGAERDATFGGDRQVYRWTIFADGTLLASETDIRSGVGAQPDARDAFSTLIAFLGSDADAYRSHMGMSQPEDGYAFGERVAEWAYGVSDELEMIGCELEGNDD